MQDLGGTIQTVLDRLWTLLVDPTSNLSGAFTLYGIITLLILILLVVAMIFIMGTPEDEDVVAGETQAAVAREKRAPRPRVALSPRARVVRLAIIAVLLAGTWVLAGFTTSSNAVCVSCHTDSSHASADASRDPHAKTACVACHEPGGTAARFVLNLPGRITHFVEALAGDTPAEGYGLATRAACTACHRKDIASTTTNADLGVKMSHAEPLATSVRCVDCHRLSAGIVSTHNAGMDPCLKCHDSKKASASCDTCHDKKVAAAARSRTTSMTADQITDLKCGACHDEKKECDTCHGTRMPHSKEFMAYAHARAAAADFWYNGGKGCAVCHTATRRPCTKCHTAQLGHAHSGSLAAGHKNAQPTGCSCHSQWAYSTQRDFCKDLCHTPAAVAASPR